MWIRRMRGSFAVLLLAAGSACASAGTATGASSSRSTITESELAAANGETAFEAVQRLRPDFLRLSSRYTPPGGGVQAAPTVLVVDGQVVGDVSDLRRIAASSLSQIRHYSVEETKRKFGMQYSTESLELTYRVK